MNGTGVPCPHCDRPIAVPIGMVGKFRVTCPRCRTLWEITLGPPAPRHLRGVPEEDATLTPHEQRMEGVEG